MAEELYKDLAKVHQLPGKQTYCMLSLLQTRPKLRFNVLPDVTVITPRIDQPNENEKNGAFQQSIP
jgi:hypothetical protein